MNEMVHLKEILSQHIASGGQGDNIEKPQKKQGNNNAV